MECPSVELECQTSVVTCEDKKFISVGTENNYLKLNESKLKTRHQIQIPEKYKINNKIK